MLMAGVSAVMVVMMTTAEATHPPYFRDFGREKSLPSIHPFEVLFEVQMVARRVFRTARSQGNRRPQTGVSAWESSKGIYVHQRKQPAF